ncbi:chorismate synthase [Victivallaceae bacterium BBE-744-WT-12]|uniref:Chorismate synthase n=1 Tax=Victivallis lenta TaxID=2606640 RepID=A0A844G4B3_9BACT|nr:chorismate synthase [Victivallis lenta]AVM45707.1 chorismate synthase [Victivallales bacterium CCUG 44730]MBS1453879.1 chorismate synthase [Lentisphaeria bacterium]MBS5531929.1 chorismate synthase [bacterium]MST97209.1 chorismate synthase [Victivallis lenta]HBP05861.1 chorismate synthase [Lentisphaeria bacterium]
MSGNTFGHLFRVTTFGESHGPGLGVIIDGVPAGLRLDPEQIQHDLDRRRPGQSKVSTMRKEADEVEILSGVMDGVTTGTALAMLIRNTDQRSRDYGNLATCFRPGHADYGYFKKYGIRDYRGGGRSSGRETAMRVAAGSVAKQLLAHYGVTIQAYTLRLGGVDAAKVDLAAVESNIVRSADPDAAEAMIAAIRAAQAEMDSVGGIIECRADGVPAGLGEPVFDKLDALIAHAVLSIGGIKGIEFGSGFAAADLRGSVNNDPITPDGFTSNHAGGIIGGISNGNTILFRAAMKPTSSIAKEQKTIDEAGSAVTISVHGRHDPCLVPRAVPVVEAMTALVLIDALLQNRCARL